MHVKLYHCICSPDHWSYSVLIITASHQTFSGQFWCLSGQNKFDLTHLLYIINGKVSVFLVDKVMSGQISTLIISTAYYINYLDCQIKRHSAGESTKAGNSPFIEAKDFIRHNKSTETAKKRERLQALYLAELEMTWKLRKV